MHQKFLCHVIFLLSFQVHFSISTLPAPLYSFYLLTSCFLHNYVYTIRFHLLVPLHWFYLFTLLVRICSFSPCLLVLFGSLKTCSHLLCVLFYIWSDWIPLGAPPIFMLLRLFLHTLAHNCLPLLLSYFSRFLSASLPAVKLAVVPNLPFFWKYYKIIFIFKGHIFAILAKKYFWAKL